MVNKNKSNNSDLKPDEGLGLFDLLWQGFSGIPALMRTLSFAIWVIIIMAVLTLAGTILPQEHLSNDPIEFGMKYQALFDVNPDDGVNSFREFFYYNFIKRFQLYKIFKTELYFTLLLLLTISSTLCAWDRLWISRKILKRTDPTIQPASVRNLKHSLDGEIPGDPAAGIDKLRRKIKRAGFQVFEKECDDGRTCFFARKNSFRLYASVAFHFALVFVLVGGILGDERTFAYDGTIALREGEIAPIGSREHAAWQDAIGPDRMSLPFDPDYSDVIELVDYQSIYRERDFDEIDPDTGFPIKFTAAPSDYFSQIRLLRPTSSGESEILVDKTIQVNFPLRYGGIWYYQSSVNTLIKFKVTGLLGQEAEFETFQYDEFNVPGIPFRAEIRQGDIVGGFWEARDGTMTPMPYAVRLVDYSAPMRGISHDPILLGYVTEDKPLEIEGITISLDGVDEYSILTYSHDPGLPITYFGFLVLTLGVTFALYLPYRTGRLVVLSKEGSGRGGGGGGVEYVAGSTWDGFKEIFDDVKKD